MRSTRMYSTPGRPRPPGSPRHPSSPGTKAYRSAVALAVLALVAAGCSGGGNGGGEAAELGGDTCEPITDGSAEGEELSVWIMEGTNPDSGPFFEEVAAAFEEQTGATLNVQYQAWGDAQTRMNNAIAGGTTPDVSEVGTTWTPAFADAGALVNLDECVAAAGLGDDLVEGLVDAGTYEGGLYGMPWYAGVRSIVYRTDVFEEAGVEPPTTWDELVQVGEAVQEAEPDMLPFAVPGDSEFGLLPFVWGAGGELAVEEGGTWTSAVDSPEAQEGIAFYTGLATEHGFSSAAAQSWDEADVRDAFARGEVTMMIAGNWTIGSLIEADPELEGKLGAFPIPGPDGGLSPSFLGGSHLGIFNNTENPELAWTFVELMTTGEFAAAWGEDSGYFPGTASLLEEVQAQEDPLVAPFAQQMVEAGTSVPVTPLYEQVQGKKTMAALLQQVLSGDATVEDASAAAKAEMDEIFGAGGR